MVAAQKCAPSSLDNNSETMIQKCFFSSLAALLVLPTMAQTQTVSPEVAAQIAAKYINHVVPSRNIRATQSSSPPYYIFNDGDGQGFVIVASDGRMHEIVGHSSTGSISSTDMPPALQTYLEGYAHYVSTLGTNTTPHKALTLTDAVAPLLTTKWNQRHPYNDLAPTLDGQRPPIGCVATAMSQVMNYHQWPLRGKGTVSYKPSYQHNGMDYGMQKVDFSQSEYAWNKMSARSETPEAAAAVAKLM